MKQIDECLTRAFTGKQPLRSKKWKAVVLPHDTYGDVLYLFHYHHRILVYLIDQRRIVYEWWEKPADRRGLESAKEWLTQKQGGTFR